MRSLAQLTDSNSSFTFGTTPKQQTFLFHFSSRERKKKVIKFYLILPNLRPNCFRLESLSIIWDLTPPALYLFSELETKMLFTLYFTSQPSKQLFIRNKNMQSKTKCFHFEQESTMLSEETVYNLLS